MRIDLPQCGLDTCRYSFDCNCTDVKRYKTCEFAYFKELEADGRLIELPCKVGDTLWTNRRMQGWYFRKKDAPYRTQVAFIGLNDSEEMGGGILNVCYENNGYMLQFNFSDIGKTIFLTEEEAEAKLAELKGDKQ